MRTLQLEIPDDLFARVSKKLGNSRDRDIGEFILCLLESFALADEPLDPETERKLLEGLNSPLIEVTDAYWESVRRRIEERHRSRGPN